MLRHQDGPAKLSPTEDDRNQKNAKTPLESNRLESSCALAILASRVIDSPESWKNRTLLSVPASKRESVCGSCRAACGPPRSLCSNGLNFGPAWPASSWPAEAELAPEIRPAARPILLTHLPRPAQALTRTSGAPAAPLPNIGPRLPCLHSEASFENVRMNVVQPAGTGAVVSIPSIGEAWGRAV